MHEFITSLIATVTAFAAIANGPESRPIGPNARIVSYPSGRVFLISPALPGNVEVASAGDVMELCMAFSIEIREPKRTLTVSEALALAASKPKAVTIDPQKRAIRVIKRKQ